MKDQFTYNFTELWDVPYRIKCTRSGDAWGISDGVLKYFDADTVRLCRPFGILVEKEATNWCLHNRDLTNEDYTSIGMDISLTEIGLDGITNSATLIQTTSTNSLVTQDCTGIGSADYITFSVYVKLISYSTTATIFITANGTDFVQIIPNDSGFARFSATAPRTSSTMTCGIKVIEDGVNFVVDCLQTEIGTYATSPIVTVSSPITRSADQVYMDLVTTASTTTGVYTDLWFNKEEGAYLLNFNASSDNFSALKQYDSVEDSQYIYLEIDRTTLQTKYNAGINGTVEYLNSLIDDDLATRSNNFVTAFIYKQGEQLASFNGFKPVYQSALADETFDLTGATRLWLGNNVGTLQIDGYLETFTYYSKFMQLSELIPSILSSVDNLAAPVLNLDSIVSDVATFTWNAIENATNYRIEVATDDTFENLVDSFDTGNVLTFDYDITDYSYVFRIFAIDDYQLSSASNTVTLALDSILTEDGYFTITEDGYSIITE